MKTILDIMFISAFVAVFLFVTGGTINTDFLNTASQDSTKDYSKIVSFQKAFSASSSKVFATPTQSSAH